LYKGAFLFNHYKRALDILSSAPALVQAMKDLGVMDRAVFNTWQLEEKEYLTGLSAEPVIETLEMEYLTRLTQLYAGEYVILN
jgi:hypothetical protein